MRCAESRRFGAASWILCLVGAALLGTLAARQATAQSCQASGSLPIFPAQSTLMPGDEFDVTVCVQNTSSTVPAPGAAVSARLLGTTTLNLACTESFCLTPLPGTLAFLPGPEMGCQTKSPGVNRCEQNALDPNRVDFVMEPGGVALGANALACFATVRVRAVAGVLNPAGLFFMQPSTGGTNIETTGGACQPPATGSASGSVPLFFLPECSVQVDKQVSCDGVTFVDAGFADGVIQECAGLVGFPVTVRYSARNTGQVPVTCGGVGLGIDESNLGIAATPVDAGVIGPGAVVTLPDDADQVCSVALASNEPDTAMLTCECGFPLAGELRTDQDTASFRCLDLPPPPPPPPPGGKLGCTWR